MSPLNPFTGIWIFHRRSNSFNPFSTFVYIYMETRFPLKIKETEKNRTRENSILQLLLSSICFDNSTMHSFLPILSSISSLYDRIHYYPFLRIVHNSKWFDDNRWRLRNERRWIFLRLKVARLKARRGEVPVVWKRVLERSPKARGLRFEGWNYSWHVVHPRVQWANGIVSRLAVT